MKLSKYFLSFSSCLLLILSSCQSSSSGAPPLIPRKVLFSHPQKHFPQISPDGKTLAYLAPNEHQVLNIWIKTVGKNDDQMVTFDPKRGIYSFQWLSDSQNIIYLQDKEGNENWNLFETNILSKRTRNLTPFDKVQARILSTSHKNKNQIFVALNLRDPRVHDVYKITLPEGELELIEKNPGNVREYLADNQGKIKALIALDPSNKEVVQIRNSEGEWVDFLNWNVEEKNALLAFSPNDTSLLVKSSEKSQTAVIMEIDLKTKNRRLLSENPHFDVHKVLFHPKTQALQAAQYYGEFLEYDFLDPKFGAHIDFLQKMHRGDVHLLSRNDEDSLWTISYITDDAPPDYYLYDKGQKKLKHLFNEQPSLSYYKLARTEPISFIARDGMKIHGYLTLPLGKTKDLPLVVLVHGGPWLRDKWGFSPPVQWLANRGYAVLQVNYRGSSGFGKDYFYAGKGQWAKKMHTDLIDGKTWAIGKGMIDPDKVAIFGASYGGYASLVGLTFTPEEFCCGVSLMGPSNLLSVAETIPPYWYLEKAFFFLFVGEPEPELLKEKSPLFRSHEIKSPLLIAHGANDPRIAQAESDQIVEALRRENKPVEYLLFPDEGHILRKPENKLKFYSAAEKFLSENLGGRFESLSSEEDWKDIRH